MPTTIKIILLFILQRSSIVIKRFTALHRSPESRIVPPFQRGRTRVFEETNRKREGVGGVEQSNRKRNVWRAAKLTGRPIPKILRRELFDVIWKYVMHVNVRKRYSTYASLFDRMVRARRGVRGRWEDITAHRAILVRLYRQVEIGRFSSVFFLGIREQILVICSTVGGKDRCMR